MSQFLTGLGAGLGAIAGAIGGGTLAAHYRGHMLPGDAFEAGVAIGGVLGAATGAILFTSSDPKPKQVGTSGPPPVGFP